MNEKIIGDRYKVIYLLGKNPGKRTVLCCDIETQQLVVIKILAWDEDFEWQNLKLFEREAQVLQSISHPAIPEYLDYFEINKPNLKGFALVQNYIEALSLEQHLKSGRTFSIEEIKQLAESLLEILIYLHSQQPQIIHRDIKPNNILLTNRSGNNIGDVYLVDFGSVQTLAASTGGTITVVGTYGYMSPEHFGGQVVPSSDLYSLGATLIYIITGIHPANLPQKDGRIEFEELINCPQDFTIWLKRMVEPFRESRYSSAKVALIGLKEPTNEVNYLANRESIENQPRTIKNFKKPFGSKIWFKKNRNKLDIVIPSQKISQLKYNIALFIVQLVGCGIILTFISLPILFLSFIILYLLLHYIFIGTIFLAIILIFIWLFNFFISVGLIVKNISNLIKIFMNIFIKERITIDKGRLILSFDWLWFKSWIYRSVPLKKIEKLEKIKIAGGDNSKWGIAIQAGSNKYKLGRKSGLTEVEIDWLCDELSEYLSLPIENNEQ